MLLAQSELAGMSSPKSSDSSRKYNEPCTIEETKDEPEDKGMESEGAGPRVKGEVKNSMAQMGQFDEYMMKSMREFQKYTSNGMEFKSYRSGPYSADRGPRSAQSSPIISNVLRSSPIAAASMKRTYTSKSPSNPIETFFSKLSSSHGKSEEISSPAEQSGDVDKQTTTSPRETHPGTALIGLVWYNA